MRQWFMVTDGNKRRWEHGNAEEHQHHASDFAESVYIHRVNNAVDRFAGQFKGWWLHRHTV